MLADPPPLFLRNFGLKGGVQVASIRLILLADVAFIKISEKSQDLKTLEGGPPPSLSISIVFQFEIWIPKCTHLNSNVFFQDKLVEKAFVTYSIIFYSWQTLSSMIRVNTIDKALQLLKTLERDFLVNNSLKQVKITCFFNTSF